MAGKMGRLNPLAGRLSTVGSLLMVLAVTLSWAQADPASPGRFFFSGDGHIALLGERSGAAFSGQYRQGRSIYDPKALEAIHGVFGAPFDPRNPKLSLRLIEFLDFLEDHLQPGARLKITSGYRSPEYNRSLRNRGALAAKASLHQYGMAADLVMEGVHARRLWKYVKALGFGGAGYYHGQTVHVDVGPARWWDEKTSGVGTGLADDNKLIGLICDYDRYRPGETMTLRFIRMTVFPIGVSPEFELVHMTGSGKMLAAATFTPALAIPTKSPCPQFADMDQMSAIRWQLPRSLPPGRYRARARFCNNPWEKMPREATTPDFEIVGPPAATR